MIFGSLFGYNDRGKKLIKMSEVMTAMVNGIEMDYCVFGKDRKRPSVRAKLSASNESKPVRRYPWDD